MESQTQRSTASPVLRLVDVRKTYLDGSVEALRGVNLTIFEGEFVAIMGPSGCGKSTLLNMLGALDRPTSGQVFFQGDLLDGAAKLDRLRAEKIGFVFQSFYLLPNLTAIENVQLPLFGIEPSPARRENRAKELLTRVGLGERFKHLPNQLSIGQRQRVAIARSLANNPSLILADEPTGSLDSQSGVEVMDLLCQLNSASGTTLVVVTHDEAVAKRAARVVRMLDGQVRSDRSTAT